MTGERWCMRQIEVDILLYFLTYLLLSRRRYGVHDPRCYLWSIISHHHLSAAAAALLEVAATSDVQRCLVIRSKLLSDWPSVTCFESRSIALQSRLCDALRVALIPSLVPICAYGNFIFIAQSILSPTHFYHLDNAVLNVLVFWCIVNSARHLYL